MQNNIGKKTAAMFAAAAMTIAGFAGSAEPVQAMEYSKEPLIFQQPTTKVVGLRSSAS